MEMCVHCRDGLFRPKTGQSTDIVLNASAFRAKKA
jgi:hypothetical protein